MSEPESEERINSKGKGKQSLPMSNALGLADSSSESSEEERSGPTKKMHKKKQRGMSQGFQQFIKLIDFLAMSADYNHWAAESTALHRIKQLEDQFAEMERIVDKMGNLERMV